MHKTVITNSTLQRVAVTIIQLECIDLQKGVA